MLPGRPKQKAGQKSMRKNRYSLEERHRLGISATARAKVRLAEKLARQMAAEEKQLQKLTGEYEKLKAAVPDSPAKQQAKL